jgi:hypothetical protein
MKELPKTATMAEMLQFALAADKFSLKPYRNPDGSRGIKPLFELHNELTRGDIRLIRDPSTNRLVRIAVSVEITIIVFDETGGIWVLLEIGREFTYYKIPFIAARRTCSLSETVRASLRENPFNAGIRCLAEELSRWNVEFIVRLQKTPLLPYDLVPDKEEESSVYPGILTRKKIHRYELWAEHRFVISRNKKWLYDRSTVSTSPWALHRPSKNSSGNLDVLDEPFVLPHDGGTVVHVQWFPLGTPPSRGLIPAG